MSSVRVFGSVRFVTDRLFSLWSFGVGEVSGRRRRRLFVFVLSVSCGSRSREGFGGRKESWRE